LDEALTAYDEAIRDFKNDVYSRSGKAETLRQMGRLDEALTAYEETIRDFKDDVVPRNGKAETLRQMGRLDEAKAMYNKIIDDFPYNQFAKRARYVLLIQKGENLSELEKQIQISNPQSGSDWILNHIHCMLLLKLNEIDEAIVKLKYGVENIKDIERFNYYSTALSYAYIKKRKFKDAVAQLKEEVNPRPVFQVLVTHAYAADGNLQESKKHFNLIFKSPIKKIDDASKNLSSRYHLSDRHFSTGKSNEDLEKEIEDLEFDLLTEPYLIAA
jgi:tetratricopeptide (TPR) repeat protein